MAPDHDTFGTTLTEHPSHGDAGTRHRLRIALIGHGATAGALEAFGRMARQLGADLQLHERGTLAAGTADIRIVQVRAHDSEDTLRRELRRDSSPVLFLAADLRGAEMAHDCAGARDDVDFASASPHILCRRLERMHDRLAALELARDSSRRDELTGLLHRRVVEAEWAGLAARHPGLRSTLFLLDVDHFKQVNDRHGHAVGDLVLKNVATLLLGQVPSERQLCRFGGEEFAWIVVGLEPDECGAYAEHVLGALRQLPHEAGHEPFTVTASIGYAELEPHAPLAEAFRAADEALYAAKARGRDQALGRDQMDTMAAELDSDVQLMHFENVTRVVTERTASMLSNFGRNLVQRAQRAADKDKLTQVWNRGYFDRRFERELKLALAHQTPLTIAVFDLDHFGRFNKQHGIPTGDAVLREFAQLAQSCARATDWFARYGGEEFVLVVRGHASDAVAVAERIRRELAQAVIPQPSGVPVHCTVSVGIASLEPGVADAVQLMQRASNRLQRAKQQGRNQVVWESTAA
jgi:diguanylate cyclase (GGDEF)-like protein